MNDLLAKLTIIIPTFKRQAYALRNMQYWSNKPARIIIIDGSECSISDQVIASFPSNITCLHRAIPVNERLILATEMISTPYAMLCGDDDFMLPSGLIECINFLDIHPDYTACCGRMIGFEPKGGGLRIWPEKPHHKDHILNHDSFEERIDFHLKNFNVTSIYGVHRTESFLFCLKFSSSYAYTNPYVGETFFELLSAAFGKSTVLSTPAMLSSQENLPVSSSGWDRKSSISDWYDNPAKSAEVQIYFETALKAFNSLSNSAGEAHNKNIILKATEARINFSRHYIMQKTMPRKFTFSDWFRRTALFRGIRFFYRLLLSKGTDYREDFYYSMSRYKFNQLKVEHGISINLRTENEMLEIFDIVLKFREKNNI